MKLIKYDNFWNDPFAELAPWFEPALRYTPRIPGLMSDVARNTMDRSLRVDVYEDENNTYVLAELPGVDKDNIDLNLENAVLTISGEAKHRLNGEEGAFRFSRSLTLAEDVDADRIQAKFENGMLRITLPKVESRKPKAIAVS